MVLDTYKKRIFIIIRAVLLSSLFSFCTYTSANKKNFITHKYSISSDIKNIRIQAHYAHIRLFQSKKKELKVQYFKKLKIKEKDSTLLVSEEGFPRVKKAGRSIGKKSVIKIWIPSFPVEVAVFGGEIEIDKFWKTNLSVFMSERGSVRIKNTKGNLNIFQKEGSIRIDSHKGNIVVQTESSRVQLRSCNGKIRFSGFKGRLEVNKSKGQLFVRSFKSPLILNTFIGYLDFQQEKAAVYLKPMIGSVSGYSKEGEVRGVIHPNEVSIETKTGRIHLDAPHSRAWVTAETWEGKIVTPVYFNRIKTGGMDRSKGQLRGKKKKGNVSLKSHSGSIRVYQSVN